MQFNKMLEDLKLLARYLHYIRVTAKRGHLYLAVKYIYLF